MNSVFCLLLSLFACAPFIRPETRPDIAANLFDFYQQREGRPYFHEIAANWMTVRPLNDRQPCEEAWQWGDLNADGIVNMEDFAVYAEFE